MSTHRPPTPKTDPKPPPDASGGEAAVPDMLQSALCILYSYGDEVLATLAWVGAGKALYGAYSGFLEMVAIAVRAARSW